MSFVTVVPEELWLVSQEEASDPGRARGDSPKWGVGRGVQMPRIGLECTSLPLRMG